MAYVWIDNPESRNIRTSGRHLREISTATLDLLKLDNDPPTLFVRMGLISRIREQQEDRGKAAIPVIESLSPDALRGIMERTANYTKNGRSRTGIKQVPTYPPITVVRDIMALPEWPFPPIAGIVEVPVLRPDGNVLTTPGYDRATSLYYWTDGMEVLPSVSEAPSAAEVARALALLEETICDFPFTTPACHANLLGLLLTPIVRPAIGGCVPLALIDAPQQGTGKGLLASVISMICTGRNANITTAPNNEEEWRKRLTSTLMRGSTIITLDNLEGTLASANLASCLTATQWEDRKLGVTDNVNVKQRATWIGTGNNIKLGGDLARRCYAIRLDAKSSTPWMGRKFRHPDLLDWVTRQRMQLVEALLTLARAWFVAGKPPATASPTIGSFEDWSRTVGGILELAGVRGFLSNLESTYAQADEEAGQWRAWYEKLHGHFPGGRFTVKDVLLAVTGSMDLAMWLPDMLAQLREDPSKSFPIRLGKAFEKREGRRYGPEQWRIEDSGDVNDGSRIWVVRRDPPAATWSPADLPAETAPAPDEARLA
jgi:hypothetical protein